MTFQYASDLHLEFPQNRKFIEDNPLVPVSDYLIIAGDLLVLNSDGSVNEKYHRILDNLSKSFKKVFVIPGNHEYYLGYDIKNTEVDFRKLLRDNIFLVNNTSELIDNIKFIFTTLWSYVPSNFPKHRFSDFSRCYYNNEKLSIEVYNSLHEKAKVLIECEINDNPRQYKTVIVTHHLPSFSLVDPIYLGSDLNSAFASFSDELIINSGAQAWIYGHSHSHSVPKVMSDSTLYTNPLGYVHHENPNEFDRSKIIWI